jgi:hypothetical protein
VAKTFSEDVADRKNRNRKTKKTKKPRDAEAERLRALWAGGVVAPPAVPRTQCSLVRWDCCTRMRHAGLERLGLAPQPPTCDQARPSSAASTPQLQLGSLLSPDDALGA